MPNITLLTYKISAVRLVSDHTIKVLVAAHLRARARTHVCMFFIFLFSRKSERESIATLEPLFLFGPSLQRDIRDRASGDSKELGQHSICSGLNEWQQ